MEREAIQNKIRVIKRIVLQDDRGRFLKVITGKEGGLPQSHMITFC
jgi:hypothetical protein